MLDRREDTKKRLEILKRDYLMSEDDISKVLGVQQRVVSNWKTGKILIKQKNYEKLCNMMLLLSGKEIIYKKQALYILTRGE